MLSTALELLLGVTYSIFFISLILAAGSALSRTGSRRYDGQSYSGIVRFNPPAAFFAVFGRRLRWFLAAVLVSGGLLGLALTVRAFV